jgi:Lon protease-like protein
MAGRTMEKGIQLVPLLPTASTVVFPRSLLQIELEAPSYASLIEDTLAGKRILGIATLKRNHEAVSPQELAPVFRTICLVRILEEERLGEDRYALLLEGSERAQILREMKYEHYRIARVEVLQDFFDRRRRATLSEETRSLIDLCEQLAGVVAEKRSTIRNIIFSHIHPGLLADTLAFHLVPGLYERQSILEERNILKRVQLVSVQIRSLVRRFTKQAYKRLT